MVLIFSILLSIPHIKLLIKNIVHENNTKHQITIVDFMILRVSGIYILHNTTYGQVHSLYWSTTKLSFVRKEVLFQRSTSGGLPEAMRKFEG